MGEGFSEQDLGDYATLFSRGMEVKLLEMWMWMYAGDQRSQQMKRGLRKQLKRGPGTIMSGGGTCSPQLQS